MFHFPASAILMFDRFQLAPNRLKSKIAPIIQFNISYVGEKKIMKHILITILIVLTIAVGNSFAFDCSIFSQKCLSEQDVVRLFGKPSKAGTLL
jgi:hypothetical protein